MRIGVISDSDAFIPLTYTLAAGKLQVYLYFAPSPDEFINQKAEAFARQAHIPVTKEKNADHDLYQWLKNGSFDVCFVIGYKHLIRLNRLANCPTQLFNIHFGPLPSYKGPIPVFWQLKHGCKNLGVSIHKLTDRLDGGPLVWFKETPNQDHYNFKTATQVLSQLCIEGVIFILNCLAAKRSIPVFDRSDVIPAWYKRPGLNDVLIDWKTMDAVTICNLVRACNPWNKGAITFYNGQEVKLMDAEALRPEETDAGQKDKNFPGGMITEDDGCLHIRCCDGSTIRSNMLFFYESYVPAYHCDVFGLRKGEKLGS